jgi:hypothetical protein
MGSMDWAECVYCEYYVRDPYLHDGIGLFGYGAQCGDAARVITLVSA